MILVFLLAIPSTILYSSLHMVTEGHVGVYWRGGRLLDGITSPGYHFKVPFLDTHENIQVTMQTDSVTNIPCGTSGGVMVHFDRIEVVNRLPTKRVHQAILNFGVNYDKMWIFDKIHHEINQFCSSHTLRDVYIEMFDSLDENLQKNLQTQCDQHDTGIEIISVRVTKPRVPEAIQRSYEQIEAEKTNLLLAGERQKVVEKEAQTESNKARIQAEKAKMVRQIEIDKEIMEKEGHKKMRAIEDESYLNTEKAKADAAAYQAAKEAEANKARLTPEFLRYTLYLALGNNTKVFYGEKIPTMLIDPWTATVSNKGN